MPLQRRPSGGDHAVVMSLAVSTGDGPAVVKETHLSTLVFAGDRVLKIRKPVTFAFVDQSTRAQREELCEREVELNRRLAPDVYLGLTTFSMPGHDEEPAVVMRRLPDQRRLSFLVEQGVDVTDELRAVAHTVAAFHASLEPLPRFQAEMVASRDAVASLWERSLKEMLPGVGTALDATVYEEVERLARRYLAGRRDLFAQRIALGRIVDGHGDLLADDIFCLDDGPRILDCLEFDERLRQGDVVLDTAFLAMDLGRMGRPDLAGQFLRWYRDLSGETHPPSLEHHYVAYRALVRAKVAWLRSVQGAPVGPEDPAKLLLAVRDHLEVGQVRLVLVGGLPGTGKTTLSESLSGELDAVVLRSDEVRKDLAGVSHTQPAPAPYRQGIYNPETTSATYTELLNRARVALSHGTSVVLDASFTDARWRHAARAVAGDTRSELVELRCVAPLDLADHRIENRREDEEDASDATPAIAHAMAAGYDPWPAAAAIDTTAEPHAVLLAARAAVLGTAPRAVLVNRQEST